MTRQDVLDILDQIVGLKRRGVDQAEVPVHFMRNRIGVALPASAFSADLQLRANGKFQLAMTRKGAHGFLDFVPDWQGLDTTLANGFN